MRLLNYIGELPPEATQNVVDLIEGWSAIVHRIAVEARSYAVWDQDNNAAGLDDFVGFCVSRDRLERHVDSCNALWLVKTADELFRVVTEEVDSGWVAKHGYTTDMVGPTSSWWWKRMPVEGPIRADFDGASGTA